MSDAPFSFEDLQNLIRGGAKQSTPQAQLPGFLQNLLAQPQNQVSLAPQNQAPDLSNMQPQQPQADPTGPPVGQVGPQQNSLPPVLQNLIGQKPDDSVSLAPWQTRHPKAVKLLDIIRNGLAGAAAGQAASSEAFQKTGRSAGFAGSFGEGIQGAEQYPIQLAQQRQQFQQGAATLAETQAKTRGLELGQQPIGPNDYGLPENTPVSAVPNVYHGIAAQNLKGQQQRDLQVLKGQQNLDLEHYKELVRTGQIVHYETVRDETGALIRVGYNRYGQPIGKVDGALAPASYYPKSTSTVEIKDDENGNYIAIPRTGTSGPQIPGVSPQGQPGAQNAPTAQRPPTGPVNSAPGGGTGGPRIVGHGKTPGMAVGTDPQGRQVAGTPAELRAAGLTNFTKLDSGESAKVNTARQMTSPNGLFALIDNDLAQFKPGELEGLAPRWNEFLAGTVGTADPRYIALRTHLKGLESTALMQAHVGSKGGEHIMEHFQNLADTGKMSQGTLKAAVAAERQYVEEKAMRPTPAGQSNSGQQGGNQGAPAGATHIAPGSDGKKHYTNASGQDLGIAP